MSESFSPLERAIARILTKTPTAKRVVKTFYSKLVYFRSKKNYHYKSEFEIFCINRNQESESFFGYFDKSPVSESGYTLVHRTSSRTDRLPQSSHSVTIAVVDPNQELLFEVDTRTFNWQQGSRAHWLDSEHFIFNDFDDELQKYYSRVFSIETQQEVRRFEHAVQDSFKSDYFLSLNYRRLMAMRPDYGYRNLPSLTEEELQQTDKDGISKVSIESGQSELLLSIDDVKAIDHQSSFDNATHKVNHVSVSRSGEHFIFLHRYFVGQRRVDRLMLSTSDGKEVKTLAAYGMVSHCFWADDSTILGYLRGPGEKDAYWLIDIHTGNMTHFANGVLDSYGDGHPHVVGDWFITDTYPDKARMQYLMLCNWKTGEVKHLGEFFHGFNFNGETRCDLHPRMSPDGNSVFFDSVFSGKRQLYRISLN
ncbi:glycosyl transferase [Vibrio owensii CAIM 1854 = LMG 25443]|uniref:Glycosyl transferase n=1 Tax=Vibrio owensii CAIM 1854 = LMG 25443 TaxID=1229493 RepID=A0A0C1Z2H3_9VIBR|nr:glycosyl transferase [Vibrio owensii CAIM 1854 = LMG 25443]